MTYREVEAERNRKDLAEFIRDKVIGDDFDFDDLNSLRKYIERNSKDEEPTVALCDWFELGNWFYEAMAQCEFDVERFMDELDAEMQAEYDEAARDRAEIEDDYLRMVGAK
jgi:hypothetical protein